MRRKPRWKGMKRRRTMFVLVFVLLSQYRSQFSRPLLAPCLHFTVNLLHFLSGSAVFFEFPVSGRAQSTPCLNSTLATGLTTPRPLRPQGPTEVPLCLCGLARGRKPDATRPICGTHQLLTHARSLHSCPPTPFSPASNRHPRDADEPQRSVLGGEPPPTPPAALAHPRWSSVHRRGPHTAFSTSPSIKPSFHVDTDVQDLTRWEWAQMAPIEARQSQPRRGGGGLHRSHTYMYCIYKFWCARVSRVVAW